MEKTGVIVPPERSDWVSQTTVQPKSHGQWRISIDLKLLNKVLKYVAVQLPTLREQY